MAGKTAFATPRLPAYLQGPSEHGTGYVMCSPALCPPAGSAMIYIQKKLPGVFPILSLYHRPDNFQLTRYENTC